MYYVYKLVFQGEDRFYIGQTKDLTKRYESHWRLLSRKIHHNLHLQNWFNKHKPSFMGMVVLCQFECKTDCDREEVRLINETYHNNFNISKKSGGGDLTSYHPNNDEIRKKISESSKKLWENHEYREMMIEKLKGSSNPNYKDGRTMIKRNYYRCNVDIKSYYSLDKDEKEILCVSCRSKSRVGNLNNFYGKTHSDETKKVISKSTKSRFLRGELLGGSRKVVADGMLFQTCSDCARFYGVNPSLITYRVKSDKWDFHYIDDDEDFSNYKVMPRILHKSEKVFHKS